MDAKLDALLPKGAALFFIGIGGVSMSALAVIAKEQGYRTGGSDRAVSRNTEMLTSMGIPVFPGHAAENIEGYDAIIYNAAIGEQNPEYAAAKAKGLPLIYRADFLSYLMRGYKNGIGVAGMHGKSTTSAMISHLFLYAQRDPAILIGAELPELGRDFRSGHGDDFIFEACEYKDSFLSFRPSIAVVLNEEMDHPDYFKSMEQIHDSFHRYLQIPGKTGHAVINADDEDVLLSAEGCGVRTVTFGLENKEADYRGENIVFTDGFASFDIMKGQERFCHVVLSVPGKHNVYNALAAAAAADLCGITADVIVDGLHTFTGAARRMEFKGYLKNCGIKVPVYDDFGHHPSEVKTTLEGAKRMGYKRLRCVYQPHTYSRTAGLFEEFCGAFDAADEVIFADIYAAREVNTFGVSSEQLAARIPQAVYEPDWGNVMKMLVEGGEEGDLIVIMGAGDISKFAASAANL
ncbi:MAG: UDP-N-acetylmuramate--L-alanine ligase [Clostridia bacterium]|nr:UDP-N-acetylmuramate--L-alanine ligase [Clostridia bacterium]